MGLGKRFLRIKKGNLNLQLYTKTVLMAVYKANHPMYYTILVAEMFLDSLMSAV